MCIKVCICDGNCNRVIEKVISDPLIAPIPAPSLLPSQAPEETPAPGEGENPGAQTEIVYEAGSLSASGEGWTATLYYPAEARIPAGAVLTLEELNYGFAQSVEFQGIVASFGLK